MQHSRWISPDNIGLDYYKSRRMVSISKSSSGSPIHFQFQSANTGSTLPSHEVPHADCYITDIGRDRQQAVKNTVGRNRTLGPCSSVIHTSGFRGGGRRGRAPPFEIPKRVFKEGQRGRAPPAPPPLLKFQRGSSKRVAAAPPPFHKSWIRP